MTDILKRRFDLALQTDIPDFQAYAEEWNKLGAEFEAAGYPANAAICFSNYKRYRVAKIGKLPGPADAERPLLIELVTDNENPNVLLPPV